MNINKLLKKREGKKGKKKRDRKLGKKFYISEAA